MPTTVCQLLVWADFLKELFIIHIKTAYIIFKKNLLSGIKWLALYEHKSFHIITAAHHSLTTVSRNASYEVVVMFHLLNVLLQAPSILGILVAQITLYSTQ